MNLKKIISKAPSSPGVYLFGDRRGKPLYIGKAANLRARLRSYLAPGWKENMLREAKTLGWHKLSSDIEALIEESRLIKEYKPRYNILFRDDKNYFFVVITRDKFPRIYLTHQPQGQKSKIKGQKSKVKSQRSKTKNQKSSEYIGPFTDGNSIKRVLRLLRTAFPYCTCSSLTRHKRRCVNAEIGKCLGFCCADIPIRQKDLLRYRANINAI
ncbi:MAG: GIY-YIG nuclease family protein, partial [Candidatus Ryanbacteria bacterium]|nr:GIY-YIG nuclease family protein [Candidatus Ryanbacteria bacterium]